MVYETKKTFEIYEISSIQNVVNTLQATRPVIQGQEVRIVFTLSSSATSSRDPGSLYKQPGPYSRVRR